MENSKYFRNDLITHKKNVFNNMKQVSNCIMDRAFDHDNDKITNDVIFNIYNKHSKKQRSIPFGTKDRYEFENTVMKDAVDMHVIDNRHHFYNKLNSLDFDKINLVDYIEVLCDWMGAMKRHDLCIEDEVQRLKELMELYKFPKHGVQLMLNTYYNLKENSYE